MRPQSRYDLPGGSASVLMTSRSRVGSSDKTAVLVRFCDRPSRPRQATDLRGRTCAVGYRPSQRGLERTYGGFELVERRDDTEPTLREAAHTDAVLSELLRESARTLTRIDHAVRAEAGRTDLCECAIEE